ncbi:MAG TPA: methyltransferase domain-containing protein [Myxococcales bacterium]|nr:methyltransferase domain-containing protein [Myxococcales bacterium]
MLQEALELLACPRCQGALEPPLLSCSRCGARYPLEEGIAGVRLAGDARTEAVRGFYAQAPFPAYPPRDSYGWLRARAERSEFARLLDRAIPGDARVLEVGCGTGQMSLFLATADRLVIGADLARPSLELAESARRRYGIDRAVFVETDLRAPGLRPFAFDVVYSSGVLHHTPDPRASFAAIVRLVRPGGMLVLGLYNAYARLPHRLRRGVARLTGFRWFPGDPVLRERRAEPARREAWLRDQYRHVEEHRHTLREVQGWFRENGVEYVRAYPDTQLAAEPLREDGLFRAVDDDWGFENLLAQLSWARTLAHEGGLFVVVGRTARERARAVS